MRKLLLIVLLGFSHLAFAADSDTDGINDDIDNCSLTSNADQLDTDADGDGDACDSDDDNDGILDDLDPCPLFDGRYIAGSASANPDITRFEVCSRQGEDAPVLEFFVEVSDNFSETYSASLLYWYVGNQQTWINLSRESESFPFRASIQLHPNAASGMYAVRSLRIKDNEKLELALNEGQLNDLGFQTKIDLVNPDSDAIPPVITSFSSDGWSFDADGSPQLKVVIMVLEEGSGLGNSRAVLELLSPTGASLQTTANFDEDGTASFTLTLSKFAASGTYPVNTVRFSDRAGHNQMSKAWLLANPQVFELENVLSDQEVPELLAFKLSATFDNASNRPVIRIDGTAYDALSKVDGVYLRLNRPGGGILDKWVSYRQYAETLDFSNQIPLTTEFQAGTYTVNYLRLNDVAENQIRLSKSDIEDLGDAFSSEISVYFPSPADVTKGSSVVVGSDNNDFIFGANSSNDVIDAGSGNDRIYTGSGDDKVQAGTGDDTIIGGSGEGDDTYDGGSGVDKVVYTSSSKGVAVDLPSGSASGEEIGTDSLVSIEHVEGGAGNDVITLDDSDNVIFAKSGDDTIFNLNMRGSDFAFGGDGVDSFYWSGSGAFTMSGDDGGDAFYPQQLTGAGQVVIDHFNLTQGDRVVLSRLLPNLGQAWLDLQNKRAKITDVFEIQGEEGAYTLSLRSGYQDSEQKSFIAAVNSVGSVNSILDLLDSDDDSVMDSSDNCVIVFNPQQLNFDSDEEGDACDTDDDNDTILDTEDAFPVGPGEQAGAESASTDQDGDRVSGTDVEFPPDATEEADSDGDGVGDNADAFPNDSLESADSDGDGVGDNADRFPSDSLETADSDGDGVGDNTDVFPNDSLESADLDKDTFGDNLDNCPAIINTDQLNTDGDAEGDACDADDDNDGYSDEEEAIDGTNSKSRFSCKSGCFSFDVDENLEAQPLTDGLLVIRHLFGFSGESLRSGAVSGEAGRDSSEAIASYLTDADSELDIDGDGEAKPLTDGLLLIRYLFGFSGDSLISGAIGSGAERDTAEEVEAYIKERVPAE